MDVAMFAGQVTAGRSLSSIVTANEQVALLPFTSTARYTIVWVPTPNDAPEANPEVIVSVLTLQLSLAVTAAYVTVREQEPAGDEVLVIELGHTKAGAWLSFTSTLNEQLAELP